MTRPPRILLIGANGQLGTELRGALASLGEVVPLTRAELDLSDIDHIQSRLDQYVGEYRPSVIVNAAAYTAVDRAEADAETARVVNADAVRFIAQAAQRAGACLVHYSTDYVFDGSKPLSQTYQESDSTHPKSVYGQTKRLGEQAVERYCARHLVFRTSWVFGEHGGNFLKTMIRVAQEREQLQVVADQWGAPTAAALIARVTSEIVGVMHKQATEDARWGLYHLVAAGAINWHGYASYVIERARAAGLPIKTAPQGIVPIATKDYPFAAQRPLNSQLSTDKIRQAFGVSLPEWTTGVESVLAQVIDQALGSKALADTKPPAHTEPQTSIQTLNRNTP